MPRVRMTYGQMPHKSVFILAFESMCVEGGFRFERDKRVGTVTFSCEQLWREVWRAVAEEKEESLLWASDVLSALGIEWI